MSRWVLLDSGPLGLLVKSQTRTFLDAWIENLAVQGTTVCLPEIIFYELRRELLRLRLTTAVTALSEYVSILAYEPITTSIIMRASELWADTRRQGRPTSDDKAIDIDVLLAATAIEVMERGHDVLVATANVAHLSRFVDSATWQQIRP